MCVELGLHVGVYVVCGVCSVWCLVWHVTLCVACGVHVNGGVCVHVDGCYV